MTQKDKVIKRWKARGYVDNYWAIKNGILRLSAVVSELNARYFFCLQGAYGRDLGKSRANHKNYYYT